MPDHEACRSRRLTVVPSTAAPALRATGLPQMHDSYRQGA
jgi:hypothetical protein